MAAGVQHGAAPQCAGLSAAGPGNPQPSATKQHHDEPSSLIRTGSTSGGGSVGQGELALGLSVQHSEFDSLDGFDLESIPATFTHDCFVVKGGGKLNHGGGSKFLTAAWRGETSGSRSGRVLAGFLAVFEAIAVAVQLEDVDVMGQPVEQRASHPFGAEDLGLFVEGQIRGHARRCVLVALGEDLDQQLGAGLRQRDVAELGHDQ